MLNSTRLKEIMAVQSKAGVGRLELNFETAFEVVESLEQAEQAVARVREFLEYRKENSAVARDGLRALDGEERV